MCIRDRSKGYSHLRVDGELLPVAPWPRLDRFKEHSIELPVAEFQVDAANEATLRARLSDALQLGKGTMRVSTPNGEQVFSTLRACPTCGTSFPEPDPRLFSYNSRHGWCTHCCGTGVELPQSLQDPELDVTEQEFASLDDAATETPCPHCHGLRLNPVALAVRFHGDGIAALCAHPVEALLHWACTLELAGREAEIGRDILTELQSRLTFLRDVGLGYLSLDRAAPTLSGLSLIHI